MKQLQLAQGYISLVDDEDFEWLSKWKWYAMKKKRGSDVYIRSVQRGTFYSDGTWKLLYLHRLLMKLQWGDKRVVDHINGNPLDNRKANLRVCTTPQNVRNRGKNSNNTSGYKGVSWDKEKKKWSANIWLNNKSYFIGYYKTAKEASKAYDKKAIKMHGEFAYLNHREES